VLHARKAEMSVYAKLILDSIGSGRKLRIPHDGKAASLVDSHYKSDPCPRSPLRKPIEPLNPKAVEELLKSGLLYRLTEHGEGARYGWRDMLLNGNKADFYVGVQ
jgi:hypothetical protein